MPLQPSERSFDEPAPLIAHQPSTILRAVARNATAPMRQRNHLDAVLLQLFVQLVAVVRAISNQILGLRFDHVELKHQLPERDFVVVRRMRPHRHRQHFASRNRFAAGATLGDVFFRKVLPDSLLLLDAQPNHWTESHGSMMRFVILR